MEAKRFIPSREYKANISRSQRAVVGAIESTSNGPQLFLAIVAAWARSSISSLIVEEGASCSLTVSPFTQIEDVKILRGTKPTIIDRSRVAKTKLYEAEIIESEVVGSTIESSYLNQSAVLPKSKIVESTVSKSHVKDSSLGRASIISSAISRGVKITNSAVTGDHNKASTIEGPKTHISEGSHVRKTTIKMYHTLINTTAENSYLERNRRTRPDHVFVYRNVQLRNKDTRRRA